MPCGERVVQVGDAVDEGVDRQHTGVVHVEHAPGVSQFLARQGPPECAHLVEHRRLVHQRLEFIFVQSPVAVGVAFDEALPQKLDELLLLLHLRLALQGLTVDCRLDHAVGGDGGQDRDHRPRAEDDEAHKEEPHLRHQRDRGHSDVGPIVLCRHLEQGEQGGPHAAKVHPDLAHMLLVGRAGHGEVAATDDLCAHDGRGEAEHEEY
mmetsp:Transcript_78724/g.227617  ORF Transcript_78724/g.227617 Transcript_78724/m.227617 type:complete len:207 (-) Transcript_78724:580-1200(-)